MIGSDRCLISAHLKPAAESTRYVLEHIPASNVNAELPCALSNRTLLRGANPISIFNLLWRNKHDSSVSPFRDGITGTFVIADGLLNCASGRLDYPVLKQFVGGGLSFQLGFARGLVAHISRAIRSIRLH